MVVKSTLMAAVLLSALLLAGCAQNVPDAARALDDELLMAWTGAELHGDPPDMENSPTPFQEPPPPTPCEDDNCELVPFTVPDLGGADVLVAIEWEGQDEEYVYSTGPGGYLGLANVAMELTILRDGQEYADGEESLHYAAVAHLEKPEPGEYVAQVVSRVGVSTYLGSVRVIPSEEPSEVLLPDLIMLPPDHLQIRAPVAPQGNDVLRVTNPGCGPDETAEDQDLRCLRFAGVLGNQGMGEFLAILEYDEATGSLAADGHWQQSIKHPNGTEERIPIGAADYHAIHGHFHILDFVETTLYTYDEQTDARGDDTGFGRKTGFCIIDGGLIDPLNPKTVPQYHGTGCCYLAGICQLDMASNPYFYMGMSAGWYDIYPWWRADQYVEISGLPDGVYEMVSVINPDLNIVETDTTNNEASTIFRLTGDAIELLEMRTQADVGPHPDADWGYTGDPNAAGP